MILDHSRSTFQPPAQSRRTLRFDPVTERAYQADALVADLDQARLAFAIRAAVLIAFILLEDVRLHTFDVTTAARVVMLTLGLALAGFTFLPRFARFRVVALAGTALLAIIVAIGIAGVTGARTETLSSGTTELVLLTFWLFTASSIGFLPATTTTALMLVMWLSFDLDFNRSSVVASSDLLLIVGAAMISALAGYTAEQYRRSDFVRRLHLEFERLRSSHLLLNVLPESIATRLMNGEEPIADRFDNVTVLFADMVGFTARSAVDGPTRTVALLNQLFTDFDRIASELGVQKIKTIGDAYMAVAGLPKEHPSHCEAIAEMALRMMDTVKNFRFGGEADINFRIGLATGPAVAGVIGQDRFVYDLWGDTVNTASRMESHGVAGRIQVTEETCHALANSYRFELRGTVEFKGLGPRTTYLMVGRA